MGALGVYLSVPFCKAKCSFCNFASGVFGDGAMPGYVGRACEEIAGVRRFVGGMGLEVAGEVDSVYLGGGTPSLLSAGMFGELFGALRGEFSVAGDAEITCECAPGQVSEESLAGMLSAGVNRVSFGVQSFVDGEGSAVGRTHTGAECQREVARMIGAGLRVGVDLICGLPGQTFESWRYSVGEAVASGVEHVSVYMLEVDEGSRLGREKMLGGVRYGAGILPGEDAVADWYVAACEWLEEAGLPQYEISNFGVRSRHNCKYWRREGYLGFGLDAHSMLRDGVGGVRWAGAGSMEEYMAGEAPVVERVDGERAFEEALFTGLRMVEGVSLQELRGEFGGVVDGVDFEQPGLVEVCGDRVRLTSAGRLVSNEVFGRLLEFVAV